MKKIFLENIKKVSLPVWILVVVMIAGIFLRTYHFHDWLRFNADQGRDSEIVSGAVEGKMPWPLLGPKAGGTEFKLGPAFYYLEIVSAKIFGNYPDKMAYPDLLTGMLCVPLLYLFLRKYFDSKISLAMSLIFAVSNYAIRYARFAWNPNSTPFWTLLALFAIHEIISQKQNRKFLWSLVAGLAIGIGVQLHTTLLIFLPLSTILIFGYLAFKKKEMLKYFFVILAFSIFLNTPQIMHEYQSKGENTKAFFEGAEKKKESVPLLEKTLHASSCWVQGNVDIISGYEISDTCSFKPEKNKDDLVVFVFGAIFVVGGTLLAVRSFRREDDYDKKSFLAVVSVFTGVTFLVFVSLAYELSVRFYLILMFLPFMMLGFWWEFIKEQMKKFSTSLMFLICILLVASNLYFVRNYFVGLASYEKNGGTVNVVILSQVEDFTNFIIKNSPKTSIQVVDGNEKFLFKAFNSMNYLANLSEVKLSQLGKKESAPERYFYIARSNKREALLNDSSVTVIAHKTHGRFTILLIEKK